MNWKTGYTLLLAIAMLVLVACNSAATPASQTQFDLPGVLIQEEVEPTFSGYGQ